MPQPRLNTTAYCLLGLFKKKPWTAYELAQFMESSAIRTMLPRTRSQIFNEPKKLATLGLVSASTESTGSREKTVYSITPAGIAAINEWLVAEGEKPKLEHVSLLKFYLCHTDDIPALLNRIEEMRQQVLDAIRQALALVDGIVEEGLILSDTAPNASLIGLLGSQTFEARLVWLDDCERQLREFAEGGKVEEMAKENYRQTQQTLHRLLVKYRN